MLPPRYPERHNFLSSKRIYPRGWTATVLVWLLDRFSVVVRKEVIGSYWSAGDIECIERGSRVSPPKEELTPDDPGV